MKSVFGFQNMFRFFRQNIYTEFILARFFLFLTLDEVGKLSAKFQQVFKCTFCRSNCTMVLIRDGNSEIGAHVWSDFDISLKQSQIL